MDPRLHHYYELMQQQIAQGAVHSDYWSKRHQEWRHRWVPSQCMIDWQTVPVLVILEVGPDGSWAVYPKPLTQDYHVGPLTARGIGYSIVEWTVIAPYA